MTKEQADNLETEIAIIIAREQNDAWDDLNKYEKEYLRNMAAEIIATVLEAKDHA